MSAVGNNLFDSGSDHNALYLSNSSGSGGIIFSTGISNGYANSTERARFYKTGELLVGIKTSKSMNSKHAVIQVEGIDADSACIRIYRNQSNQNAPSLDFGKSRGSCVLDNSYWSKSIQILIDNIIKIENEVDIKIKYVKNFSINSK